MGTGDWNDGMNRVGREGRGESVWLGFFLADILRDLAPVCARRGDAARAERYRAHLAQLAAALNDGGWDGGWYRRAYYDDGTPLGSAQNDECRIDTIAQAWAVLSRVAPAERAEQALDALEAHLVSDEERLVRLLTPAFDATPHDPGYIKGYVPGVRENGGRTLSLRPCIPARWPGFRLRYRLPDGRTAYDVVVRRGGGAAAARVDGAPAAVTGGAVLIPLARDGAEHRVEVTLGTDVGPRYEG
jgi:cellobiose phosphorylase